MDSGGYAVTEGEVMSLPSSDVNELISASSMDFFQFTGFLLRDGCRLLYGTWLSGFLRVRTFLRDVAQFIDTCHPQAAHSRFANCHARFAFFFHCSQCSSVPSYRSAPTWLNLIKPSPC